MARLSTCKKCGRTSLQPSEKSTMSGKTYCNACYEILRIDADAYKALIDDICKTFNIDVPTGLILKQIKEYKTELHYSYAAMRYTLWYIREISRISLDVKFGIVMIKYTYDEAKQHYEQQERISNSVTDVELKTKIVTKKKSVSANNYNSLIDITKLVEGDDSNKL
ncbi:MAG: hypothetical protein RSF40_01270 [Oscillospiraceae bacterium]